MNELKFTRGNDFGLVPFTNGTEITEIESVVGQDHDLVAIRNPAHVTHGAAGDVFEDAEFIQIPDDPVVPVIPVLGRPERGANGGHVVLHGGVAGHKLVRIWKNPSRIDFNLEVNYL